MSLVPTELQRVLDDRLAEISPTDFAWFCGLFEGEGCFRAAERRLSMTQTDLDVLERVQGLVGGQIGMVSASNLQFGTKDQWRWQLAGWPWIEPLVKAMLPQLGARRRQKAEELLANPPKRIHAARYGFCRRGHVLRESGVYSNGKCRPCGRAERREYRQRVGK